MKKKKVVGLMMVAVIVVLLMSQVVAAVDTSGDNVLEGLYEEMHQLRKQIVERRVELGEIAPEQGEAAIERMEENDRYRAERFEDGTHCGRGGRGGHGGLMGWRIFDR